MSLTYQRSRITGAGLVAAQYDLTLERQTIMDNILFIPGIANPVSEIRQLLFRQGQPGGGWVPSFSPTMIAANSFGSGVTDILDLSGNNNPFSQATPSSRGAWFREPKTGRRNLLTRSNQFSTSPWGLIGAGAGLVPVITPNAGVDPAGGNDAFRIDFNRVADTISDSSELTNTFTPDATSGQAYTGSIYIKAATSGDIGKNIAFRHVGSAAYGSFTLTSEWQRISRTETAGVGASSFRFGSRGTFNTSTAVSILAWQAQLELGSTATQIQTVTTAFDVTEAGQRDCFGVRADGIDDFYTTASTDFTGTDKVTVFAAVRKLSDAAAGVVLELSSSSGTGFGKFGMFAPSDVAANYMFRSAGTSNVTNTVTTFAAPITNIVTGIADIGADVNIVRVNGTQAGSVSTDQGTGNYANDILYLFRRGGTTLPFNGNLYALIVAGGSYPLSTIQRVERILSRITPTVNL
jgi:uncharacterized membrane protein